jgi:SynChlorMet cassette radical SAM/SPASM protein ScmE
VEKDLPTKEWLAFFEECGQCGVMDATFEGGEPMIRKDFLELVDGVVDNRMRFSVLTNGTLATDEIARHIASSHRCNNVQVSIDASTPECHEYSRGKGSFQRAIDGMHHLIDNKVPVSVRITLHKGNVAALEDTIIYLLEEVGLRQISTNMADYLGSCRQNSEKIQLSTAERSKAMETLLTLRKKYGGRISALAGPQADATHWHEMEMGLREGRDSKPPSEGHLTSCGCPMNKMGVRADGAYVPCIQLSHLVLGWMNKNSLRDVWQQGAELNRLRERVSISMDTFEYCKGCKYVKYCNGGCPATAYTTFGEVNHPNPDGCLRRFLESGGKLPEESLY